MSTTKKAPPQDLEPGALSGPLGEWFKRSLSPWSAHAFTVGIILVLLAWLTTTLLGRVWYLLWWFIIAAFLTPPDAVSQSFMAVPMYLLYELGIVFARFAQRRRAVEPAGSA